MFQAKPLQISGFRLTALALVATSVAGCSSLSSLNPFGNDETSSAPTPVSRPAQPSPQRSQSIYGDSATQQTTYQQRLEPISEPVPIAPGAPDQYTVQQGDTLWDIASTFLSDPWYWPEVWYVNPQVENPHLIYPGDVLALVTID
ncbi:MAG: LysM peptidoglycan-binding domain-containing protein, partial [Pseudomonadota bacterium]